MRRARRKFQNILIFAIDFFSGCGNISVWSRFRFGRLVEGYYHQSSIPFLCRFFGLSNETVTAPNILIFILLLTFLLYGNILIEEELASFWTYGLGSV